MVDIGLVKNENQSIGGPLNDPFVTAVRDIGAAVAANPNPLVSSESDIRQAVIEQSRTSCLINSTRLCGLFNDQVVSIEVQFTKADAKKAAEIIFKEWKTPSQPQPVTIKFIEMLFDPENFRRIGPILNAIASGENGVEIITGLVLNLSGQIRTKVLALCSMEDSARAALVIERIIALSPDKLAAQGDLVRIMNLLGGFAGTINENLPLSPNDERLFRLVRLQMFSAAAQTLREKGFNLSHELLEICARYDAGATTLIQQRKLQRDLARFSDSRTNGQISFSVEFNSQEDDPKRTGQIRWLDVIAGEKGSATAASDYDSEFEVWLRTEDDYRACKYISHDALRECYRYENIPTYAGVPSYHDVVDCALDKIATSCFQSTLDSRNLKEMPLDGRVPFDIVDDVGKCYERNSGLKADSFFTVGPENYLEKGNFMTWDEQPTIKLPGRPDGVRILFDSERCEIAFPSADYSALFFCTPNGQCTDVNGKSAFLASNVEDAIEKGRAYYCGLDPSSVLCKSSKSEDTEKVDKNRTLRRR